jgi:hypothetical protein
MPKGAHPTVHAHSCRVIGLGDQAAAAAFAVGTSEIVFRTCEAIW